MKLKKCPKCENYTLVELCQKCKSPTKNAHYKYISLRSTAKEEA